MTDIVLLGYGNVANHLVTAILESEDCNLLQMYNRTEVEQSDIPGNIPFTTRLEDIPEADLYLLCVSDTAIPNLSASLPFSNRLVAHVSGATSMEAIYPKNRRAVCYPLQTFTKGREISLKEVPFCLEAENETDMKTLQAFAGSLSSEVHTITSEQRRYLHLAAVFANNFTNHLFGISEEILKETHLSLNLLRPLLLETVHKALDMHPENAQTGPAVRSDQKTIHSHLDLLKSSIHKEIYTLLTRSISQSYGRKKL